MLLLLVPLVVGLSTQPATPPAPTPIEPCDSMVIAQTRSALEELQAAEATHSIPGHPTLTAVYAGTVSIEAHLMRPGMVRTLPARVEVVADPRMSRLRVRETTGPAEHEETETTVVRGRRVAQQPSAQKPFTEVEAAKAAPAVADAALWLPSTAARAAHDAAPSCRPGPAIEIKGVTLRPVTFTDVAGCACTLLIDPEHRVQRIERLESHPRLGDVCCWTQFGTWEQHEGAVVPRRISRFIVQGAATVRYELELVSFGKGPETEGAFELPEIPRGDIPTRTLPSGPPTETNFVLVAPGLWSVELSVANSRVLVIERPGDLVVLGAPDGDAVCDALVRSLRDRFPDKTVGTAAFGHHHPSPSGGLRALAATGATIVCPRAMEPYARALLSRPTSLGPPAVAGPDQVRLELFEREKSIECGDNTVRLIDIGERSAHAFSYVVFYFPGLGILFEDDLGYFPRERAARITPRLMGLVGELESLHIEPTRLMQAWPVRGTLGDVEWAIVAGMARAERESRQRKETP